MIQLSRVTHVRHFIQDRFFESCKVLAQGVHLAVALLRSLLDLFEQKVCLPFKVVLEVTQVGYLLHKHFEMLFLGRYVYL